MPKRKSLSRVESAGATKTGSGATKSSDVGLGGLRRGPIPANRHGFWGVAEVFQGR